MLCTFLYAQKKVKPIVDTAVNQISLDEVVISSSNFAEKQKNIAQTWKDKLNASNVFPDPIVTEITAVGKFYKAEDYHQNYFKQNGFEPYCQIVIKPKMEKFEKAFKDKIK